MGKDICGHNIAKQMLWQRLITWDDEGRQNVWETLSREDHKAIRMATEVTDRDPIGLYLIWNILRRDLGEWGVEIDDDTNDPAVSSWSFDASNDCLDSDGSDTLIPLPFESLAFLSPSVSTVTVVVALNESLEELKFQVTRMAGGNHEVKTMDTLNGDSM